MGLGEILGLLTIGGEVGIFALVTYRIWTKGIGILVNVAVPPITVTLPEIVIPPITVDMSRMIPTPLVVQVQPVPPEKMIYGPDEEAMPEEILDYCEQESEPHWRNARKKRARELRQELGSWDAAFRALQREDNPPEAP